LLVDKIDAFLGFPQSDPHGDPIPSADGTIAASAGMSLASLAAGDRFQVVRVSDQSPEFLRYLTDAGLEIGAGGSVAECRPQAGVVVLNVGGRQTTLSGEIAAKLLVVRQ
jgi:DtxR family Mn-dependent transcriptional regulator